MKFPSSFLPSTFLGGPLRTGALFAAAINFAVYVAICSFISVTYGTDIVYILLCVLAILVQVYGFAAIHSKRPKGIKIYGMIRFFLTFAFVMRITVTTITGLDNCKKRDSCGNDITLTAAVVLYSVLDLYFNLIVLGYFRELQNAMYAWAKAQNSGVATARGGIVDINAAARV